MMITDQRRRYLPWKELLNKAALTKSGRIPPFIDCAMMFIVSGRTGTMTSHYARGNKNKKCFSAIGQVAVLSNTIETVTGSIV